MKPSQLKAQVHHRCGCKDCDQYRATICAVIDRLTSDELTLLYQQMYRLLPVERFERK